VSITLVLDRLAPEELHKSLAARTAAVTDAVRRAWSTTFQPRFPAGIALVATG
jgi:hypothetical protein